MSVKDLKAVDPTTFERVPPHNIEAEQSLLGAMLLSSDATGRVIEHVRPEYFYREAHRHVFEAITKLFTTGDPPDPIVVAEELAKMGVLEKIGGKLYIHTLLNFVPTAANAEHYARILERHSLLRGLIRAATDIASIGYQDPDDLEGAIDKAESLLFNVSKKRISEKFSLLEDLLAENWDLMDKLARSGSDITGISSGFTQLDKYTSGLQPSDLIVIAARPAMGKTSFVLNIARNIAVDSQKAVALFSLEMSKIQIAQRLLSSEAMVPSQKLRSPQRLTGAETERLVAASGRLSKARLFVDDTANITIMEIRAKARRLVAREELGLIIVDYLQLIHGGGRAETERLVAASGRLSKARLFVDDTANITIMEIRAKARRLVAREELGLIIVDYLQLIHGGGRAESRQLEISEISRSLKILGRELGVPVIAVSQLSRAVENRTDDRRPRLADLRDSGAIEQDADIVIFIYRDERYNPDSEDMGKAEIIISKHRNGPTGTIKLAFLEEYAKFENLEDRYAQV